MPLQYVCFSYLEKIEFLCSLFLEENTFYCTVAWNSRICFPCNMLAVVTCAGCEEENQYFSIQNKEYPEIFRVAPAGGLEDKKHNLRLILTTETTMIEILNVSFKSSTLPEYSGVSVTTGVAFNLQQYYTPICEAQEMDQNDSVNVRHNHLDNFAFIGDESRFGWTIFNPHQDSY